MSTHASPSWNLERLDPFGAIVTPIEIGARVETFSTDVLSELIGTHRVVVLRGFAPLEGSEMPDYCRRLGKLAEWDFGVVNELKQVPDTRNYLYTNSEVPFHWDGAFVGLVPRYIFFQCDAAPPRGTGGETLFADTTLILRDVDSVTRAKWDAIDVTYSTEKIVHYGGSFTSPIICRSKNDNEVIRFAEPVVDLNPVPLEIDGLESAEHAAFLRDMHDRLNDERYCYRHQWVSGDIVVADNLVLLHGRAAFNGDSPRSIRRVNIL